MTDTAAQRPAASNVSRHIMQHATPQLTSVQKSTVPADATTAEALDARAQLQHTAYPPQQLVTTEHISQLAASSELRPQKEWHNRHIIRMPPPSPPQSPTSASACPLAHWREKSTFFPHTRPSSSTHSVPKVCEEITLRLGGRKVPRKADLTPSASI